MRKLAMAAFAGLAVVLCCAQAPQEKFPKFKWFNDTKGYNEALELQKTTGADVFLYFARYGIPDEKGRCHWLEMKGFSQPGVEKFMRDFIKVKFTLGMDKASIAMAEKYKVKECPVVVILQTNGWWSRANVFEWPGNKPQLLPPDTLVANFREKADDRYQLPPEDVKSK
jgi:hypothetical protein